MEASSTQKRLFTTRGRWSVRMDSDLLDYVQHFNYPWGMVADKLGFNIDVGLCTHPSWLGMQTALRFSSPSRAL